MKKSNFYNKLNEQAKQLVKKFNSSKNQDEFDSVIEECKNLGKCEYQITELLEIAYEVKHNN